MDDVTGVGSPHLSAQLSPFSGRLSIGLGRKPGHNRLPIENNEHAKHLQGDEGYDTAVDGGDINTFRRNTFEVEDRKPDRWREETRLQAHGKQNREPHRVEAKIRDHRSHQGQHDKGQLDPIEKEAQ